MNLIEFVRLNYSELFEKEYRTINDVEVIDYIKTAIEQKTPVFLGRLGATETFNLRVAELNERRKYEKAVNQLCNWSGFFPEDAGLLNKFAEIERDAIREVDLIHPMQVYGEKYIIQKYASKNTLYCNNFGCWHCTNPWTKTLAGKKVLVIHPFTESIEKQYARRELIFPDVPEMLPEFELHTIKAVQTLAGEKDDRFNNWFEALEWMCLETLKVDYDVALIGCGAYGFPLGAFCKKQGKIAIHMGGDLQMQFGIIGTRWKNSPVSDRVINEYWISPSENETIQNMKVVENGCYW